MTDIEFAVHIDGSMTDQIREARMLEQIAELVANTMIEQRQHRGHKFTLKQMAAELTTFLEPAGSYQLAAIWNWLHQIYKPDYRNMHIIFNSSPADTWQHQFAEGVMRILKPGNWDEKVQDACR